VFSVIQNFNYTYNLHEYQSQNGNYLFTAIYFLKKKFTFTGSKIREDGTATRVVL